MADMTAGRSPAYPGIAACLLAMILVVFPFSGNAQETPRYGFVNISRVIAESQEGRTEAGELEALGTEKEQRLQSRQEELQGLMREYEQSVSDGKPNEALGERIEQLRRELERDIRQARSDVDTSRQDRIQAIGTKVIKLVRQFARKNGYTAIFRTDGGQVVYAAPTADVTEQVIEVYNRAYPAE